MKLAKKCMKFIKMYEISKKMYEIHKNDISKKCKKNS